MSFGRPDRLDPTGGIGREVVGGGMAVVGSGPPDVGDGETLGCFNLQARRPTEWGLPAARRASSLVSSKVVPPSLSGISHEPVVDPDIGERAAEGARFRTALVCPWLVRDTASHTRLAGDFCCRSITRVLACVHAGSLLDFRGEPKASASA